MAQYAKKYFGLVLISSGVSQSKAVKEDTIQAYYSWSFPESPLLLKDHCNYYNSTMSGQKLLNSFCFLYPGANHYLDLKGIVFGEVQANISPSALILI